jgi:hypothetical protein
MIFHYVVIWSKYEKKQQNSDCILFLHIPHRIPLGIFSLSLSKLKNAINIYFLYVCILSVIIYIKTFLFKTI